VRRTAKQTKKGSTSSTALPFGVGRYAPIRRLVQATEFSDDDAMADIVDVVRMIKAFPGIHGQLLRIGEPLVRRHRRRPGTPRATRPGRALNGRQPPPMISSLGDRDGPCALSASEAG
jgi:hypothetical protein